MFCKRPGVARPFLCLVAFLAASRIPVNSLRGAAERLAKTCAEPEGKAQSEHGR